MQVALSNNPEHLTRHTLLHHMDVMMRHPPPTMPKHLVFAANSELGLLQSLLIGRVRWLIDAS
jgi:hypothetical protein